MIVDMRCLPHKGAEQVSDVVVQTASSAVADWWHSNIQPVITRDKSRADNEWSWPLICSLHDITIGNGARYQTYAVCLRENGGASCPIDAVGMPIALVHTLAPCPSGIAFEGAMLILHLSTIPKELLPNNSPVRLVGSSAMDLAIVRAMQMGFGGQVLLMVGEKDRERLLTWYQDRCGMRLAPARPDLGWPCLVHTALTANAAYARLNQFRLIRTIV